MQDFYFYARNGITLLYYNSINLAILLFLFPKFYDLCWNFNQRRWKLSVTDFEGNNLLIKWVLLLKVHNFYNYEKMKSDLTN